MSMWPEIMKYYKIILFIKSAWQFLVKRFAYKDTWSLDYSLAKWIIPRLKYLRDNTLSSPPNLEIEPSDKSKFLTIDEWKDRINKMLYAFEFILTEDDIMTQCYPKDYDWTFTTKESASKKGYREIIFSDDRKPDYTYYNQCESKYQEGIKLFCLYFRHLWH